VDIIQSRVGLKRIADVVIKSAHDINNADYTGIIFVDEAQFLDIASIDALRACADTRGISVTCYGLKTDFTSHLFDGSRRLLEVAECEEVPSECSIDQCKNKSLFNMRYLDGGPVFSGPQIILGFENTTSAEHYSAVCSSHYYKYFDQHYNATLTS